MRQHHRFTLATLATLAALALTVGVFFLGRRGRSNLEGLQGDDGRRSLLLSGFSDPKSVIGRAPQLAGPAPQLALPEQLPRRRRLADGCHHVYLDLGANIGVHSRFLFEPEKYPDAKTGRKIFDEQFGTRRDGRDICAFAFEPNPQHAARHEELSKAYEKMGWRYRFIQAGVSDSDSELTFYKNAHRAREKASELGFSVEDRGGVGRDRAVVVPTIRLASWLEDEVGGRELPSRVHGTYPGGNRPRVVAKLDVESHEYAVLPDVLFTGALCRNVDFLFSELHGWNKEVDYAPDPNTGRGGMHLMMKTARETTRRALELMHTVKDCRTTFRELDDEAYALDGVPLP